MWEDYSNTLRPLLLLLGLLLLAQSFSYSEESIILTMEEFNQIQEALTISETELNLAKQESQKALDTSNKVSSILETVLVQFNEREKFLTEQNNALQKEIKINNIIFKLGIGVLGTALIASLIGG